MSLLCIEISNTRIHTCPVPMHRCGNQGSRQCCVHGLSNREASLRVIVSLGRVLGRGRADNDVMSADGSSEGADT